MTTLSNEVTTTITAICDLMGRLAKTAGYRESMLDGRRTAHAVVTEVAHAADVLPNTGEPVRGSPSLRYRIDGPAAFDRRKDLLQDVAWSSSSSSDFAEGSDGALRSEITEAVSGLFVEVGRITSLRDRFFEAAGFKTYDAADYAAVWEDRSRGGSDGLRAGFAVGLDEIFRHAITSAEVHDTPAGGPVDWERVGHEVAAAFAELHDRRYHRFEALAFLNAPTVDHPNGILVGEVAVGDGGPEQLFLTGVRDADLSEVLTYVGSSRELPPGVADCNSVVRFGLSMAVDATLERSLELYPEAAAVVRGMIDLLRLVRSEDLGVNHFVIRDRSYATPTLRNERAVDFVRESAAWLPRRTAYRGPGPSPLDDREAQTLVELAQEYLSGKAIDYVGFRTGLRRMQYGIERYTEADPQRLLEFAIALEALLLNDDPRSELTFRLALRGARLLRDDLEGRERIFNRLKELYAFRSRLAHGDMLDDLNETQRKKLVGVEAEALPLLREVLVSILRGRGPRGVAKKDLPAWWRRYVLQ